METMSADSLDQLELVDHYRDAVVEIIEAKAEHHEPHAVTEEPEPAGRVRGRPDGSPGADRPGRMGAPRRDGRQGDGARDARPEDAGEENGREKGRGQEGDDEEVSPAP
ncbi:hypothetical protein [Streptomyces tritici]|uniref:hypothetical protein n=1 Tax=Streptomyces tritici TaxID=2054410 RepID=UPI003AF101EE